MRNVTIFEQSERVNIDECRVFMGSETYMRKIVA
jgi:hypothetical protein